MLVVSVMILSLYRLKQIHVNNDGRLQEVYAGCVGNDTVSVQAKTNTCK